MRPEAPADQAEAQRTPEIGAAEASTHPQTAAIALLPLRIFLGLTFIYAAYQKVADPGFLHPGSPTYIGAQARAFAHGSPIGPLLVHLAVPHPALTGYLVIATEWTVGVLVLVGTFTRLAAAAGFLFNLGLFLSASWNVYPYFLGADVVFAAAWATLAIGGPGPFAFGSVRQRTVWERLPAAAPPAHPLLTRSQLLLGCLASVSLVILGVIPRAGPSAAAPHRTPAARRGGSPGARGRLVGRASQIPVNAAASLVDPTTGRPAIIMRASGSVFLAYDATCTHAGCTVQYDPQSGLLVCPCHGAQFDPADKGKVLRGPAVRPLSAIPITVDQHGNLYLEY